jgi:hypothetical protein
VSEHSILALLLVLAIIISVVGFAYMHRMLREAQRLTRSVAAMVYQENEKTRAAFFSRPYP